ASTGYTLEGWFYNSQGYLNVGPILPRNQAGAGGLFTATAYGGSAPISSVFVIVGSDPSNASFNYGCAVYYEPTTSLVYLAADNYDASYWVGSAYLGGTGVLSNSQCTINAATSSATRSSDGMGVY